MQISGDIMNYLFIVNPKSGKGKSIEVSNIIKNYMDEKNIDYNIIYTNKKDDAMDIANMYKNKYNCIYSVGGDGTLNEVVNGIIGGNSKLGIIPVGSGNDFYKSFKINNSNEIDVGVINNSKYFINIASVGLDADIADYANYLKDKNYPNDIVYILSLIRNYFKFKPIKTNINNEEKIITLLAVCNGMYYGGGFKIAPNANLSDGKFDIYKATEMNKIKLLNVLFKLLKGIHSTDKTIEYKLDDTIKIESVIPLIYNVDGEIIKEKNVEIKLLPKKIKLDINDNKELIKKLRL